MKIDLTHEAFYRLQERLGILLQGRAPTPHVWDDVAMGAKRWQTRHDKGAPTRTYETPKSPIMDAEQISNIYCRSL